MKKGLILLLITTLTLVSCAVPSVGVPGVDTLADNRLTADVMHTLKTVETGMMLLSEPGVSSFGRPRVVAKRIVKRPQKTSGEWTEEWTVQRDSGRVLYSIIFRPTPAVGGTDILISAPPTKLP